MLYAVATRADTSSSQAIKDPGVVIVISVKLYEIKSIATNCVAATFVAARTLLENSRFLTS